MSSRRQRDSNALRASVLDAALQLGIGSNNAVAQWMFEDVIEEQEESCIVVSPGLTSASTSDDSHPPRSPSSDNETPAPRAGAHTNISYSPEHGISAIDINISAPAPAPTPTKFSKLRKFRKGGDGNESDGGYLSEAKRDKKKADKERKKEEKQRKKDSKKKDDLTEYESDGGYLSSASHKKSRFRSLSRSSSPVPPLPDAKSPKKPKKRGFFRRSRSKPDDSDAEEEPVPPLPPPVLPIAQRYGHTHTHATSSESDSRVYTPSLSTTSTTSASLDAGWITPDPFRSFTPTPSLVLSPPKPDTPPLRLPSPSPRSRSPKAIPAISLPNTRISSPSRSRTSSVSTGSIIGNSPKRPPPLHPSALLTPNSVSSPEPSGVSSGSSVVPSSAYLVPSPRPALAYSDIPPPSPPPTGPLPSLPSPSQQQPPVPPFVTTPIPGNSRQPTLHPHARGRAAPFPAPPRSTSPSPLDGFSARVQVPRYRTLYGLDREPAVAPGLHVEMPSDNEGERDAVKKEKSEARVRFRSGAGLVTIGPSISVEDTTDDDSIRAASDGGGDDRSHTLAVWYGDAADRSSRYSASVYSRASMDEEQFVEAGYGEHAVPFLR